MHITITVTATSTGTATDNARVTAKNVTDSPDGDDTFSATTTVHQEG